MRRSSKNLAGKDITAALAGWNFEPGQVNVRIIRGKDGKPKIQLRLDLGLLQMELNGRPDGKRPHNNTSELDHQLRRLEKHRKMFGEFSGFSLSASACAALRAESAMFYHRYLSLFVLEQFDAVIRDTQHSLDVLDLCHHFANEAHDRYIMEQYRPYILMMQGRSRACRAMKDGFTKTALAYLKTTLRRVLELYPKPLGRRSYEAQVLMTMIRELRHGIPMDPLTKLRRELRRAVAAEQYERAANLRDELTAMETLGAINTAPSLPAATPAAAPARRRYRPRRERNQTAKHAPSAQKAIQPPEEPPTGNV